MANFLVLQTERPDPEPETPETISHTINPTILGAPTPRSDKWWGYMLEPWSPPSARAADAPRTDGQLSAPPRSSSASSPDGEPPVHLAQAGSAAPRQSATPTFPSATPAKKLNENEFDAALEGLYGATRLNRARQWDEMLTRQPPPALPGSRLQAPLPDDWRKSLNGIDPTYADLTDRIGAKHSIPPELLARHFYRESNFNKHAGTRIDEKTGTRVPVDRVATGIPQMFEDAARSVGTSRAALAQATAEVQLEAGAAYLAKLYKQFESWPKAIAAYHSGETQMNRWFKGEGPNYESVEQRRQGYMDRATKKTILPDSSTAETQVRQWQELMKHLPYVFLGDQHRYSKP